MTKRSVIAAVAIICAMHVHAATFDGSLVVRPSWDHKSTGVTTVSESFSYLLNWAFTDGTNANQMTQLWRSRRTLTNSATETINLLGGVTNAFGEALTMGTVRMLAFSSASSNTASISIGGAAATVFSSWLGDASDVVVIRPTGFLLLVGPDATGYSVGTNGSLKVSNNGTNNVTYDIYVGASE